MTEEEQIQAIDNMQSGPMITTVSGNLGAIDSTPVNWAALDEDDQAHRFDQFIQDYSRLPNVLNSTNRTPIWISSNSAGSGSTYTVYRTDVDAWGNERTTINGKDEYNFFKKLTLIKPNEEISVPKRVRRKGIKGA